jgi:hypothetical protein
VYFESPQHATAAGYRPSMDYASFARREQRLLSGEALPVTTGAPIGSAGPSYSGGYSGSGGGGASIRDQHVSGYWRNGAYVNSYMRSSPRR